MGHQDNHLELRAMFANEQIEEVTAPVEPIIEDATPLLLDHDTVRSWRETARYFRKAA